MKKKEQEQPQEMDDVFAGIDFGELIDTSPGFTIPTEENEEEGNEHNDESLSSLLSKQVEENSEESDESEEEDTDSENIDNEDAPPLNDTDSDESEDTSSSTLNAVKIAKAFYEEGGLSSFDEEEFLKLAKEKSPGAALMNMLKKEVDYNIEEYKKSLSPEERIAAEAKELGVDAQELSLVENDIQILKGITDEHLADSDTRAKLLRYYYQTTTKFSPERIEKEIKRLEDLEEAEEEVKNAIPELIKTREADLVGIKDKAKEYKNTLIKQEEERVNNYKKYVEELKEIIPGTKINKPTQAKIQDAILKPVKEVNGRKLNAVWAKREADPIKFDTIMAYLMLEGVFDGKWGSLTSKTKTKAFEDLEQSLRTQRQSTSSAPNLNSKSLSAIEEMRKAFGK